MIKFKRSDSIANGVCSKCLRITDWLISKLPTTNGVQSVSFMCIQNTDTHSTANINHQNSVNYALYENNQGQAVLAGMNINHICPELINLQNLKSICLDGHSFKLNRLTELRASNKPYSALKMRSVAQTTD